MRFTYLFSVSMSLGLCALTLSAFAEVENRCLSEYTPRLKEPGRMKIAVALGYSDSFGGGFDLVRDGLLFDELSLKLTEPCTAQNPGFCDFDLEKIQPHEPRHYYRKILSPTGETFNVDVYLMNSSFEVSHSKNQTEFQKEQLEKSQDTQRFYSWALENADIVLYDGHSRDGGGPDFSPPNLNSHGKIDYAWYHKNQPGLKAMIQALQKTKSSPIYLGLFSCASDGHFTEQLTPLLHQTSLILSTKLIEGSKAKESLFHSLDSILNFNCKSDLKNRIEPLSFIIKDAE